MTNTSIPFEDDRHRQSAYQYLETLARGRRVLEVGSGSGWGLVQMLALGAREVVGLSQRAGGRPPVGGDDPRLVVRGWRPPRLELAGPGFDLVLIPDARILERHPELLEEAARVLSPGGHLVLRAPSGDGPAGEDGLTYGEILDLVEPLFSRVHVVGQATFLGCSLVELAESPAEEMDISLDASLMGGEVEEVDSYLVIASQEDARDEQPLPYGIVQVPATGEAGLGAWQEGLEETLAGDGGSVARGDGRAADAPREPEALRAGEDATSSEEPSPPSASPSLDRLTDSAGGLSARWRWPEYS